MSKFAIFLCGVFFVSLARASYVPNTMKRIKREDINMKNFMDGLIVQFKNAESAANKTIAEVLAIPEKIMKEGFNNVSAIIEQTENKIKDIITVNKDVNATECGKLVKQLGYSVFAVISKMSSCVTDKVKEAVTYIENIRNALNNQKNILEMLSQDAERCFKHVDNLESGIEAFFCSHFIEAALQSATTIPSILGNVFGLGGLVVTLQQSLQICIPTRGIQALVNESWIFIDQTRRCVEQKFKEASSKKRLRLGNHRKGLF